MKTLASLAVIGLMVAALIAPAMAAPPQPQGTIHLQDMGEPTAIHHVTPKAAGTELGLRDGEILFVPKTAKTLGTLQVGAWVHGYIAKSQDGQNVVQWLEVEGAPGVK